MAVSSSAIRPFSAVPGPKRWPVLGTSLGMISHFGKWHILNEKRFQMYGPIWREAIPQFGETVVIADARGVRELARAVDQKPIRTETPIWRDYYKARGLPVGIMHANGQDWQRMRKAIDKPILKPSYIGQEVPKLAQVVREFVHRLGQLRLSLDGSVPSIDEELFKWALESSSIVLYGRRMGCLDPTPPQVTTEFIQCVQNIMEQMVQLLLIPPFVLKTFMKDTWQDYLKNWDIVFRTAQASIQGIATNGQDPPRISPFLESIISSQAMSMEEICSNMSELMMASVDTTSSTAQAVLFELARRPDIQDKIFEEVSQHLPHECQDISYEHLMKLPYLKGTIKECERLYPVGFNVIRRLLEDTVICGYHIPKHTVVVIALYPLGRNPEYFEEPEQLVPERWLRGEEESMVSDPFAFVPFGLGQRSCVGKRLANIELELLISEIVRRYKVNSYTSDLPMTNKFLLMPEITVNVRLTPRQSS